MLSQPVQLYQGKCVNDLANKASTHGNSIKYVTSQPFLLFINKEWVKASQHGRTEAKMKKEKKKYFCLYIGRKISK